MPNNSQLRPHFRKDINGLRAWAVMAVIFYHFGIPGFNGGFIGVDVFFVISGYLMTAIILKGLEQGQFSIIDFYLARARRIFPALLALCSVLLILGWFLLSPPDYKTLGTHTISAISFISNFKFWDEAGYFDIASHEKWLLHTWSLSVEWQFYLLLPLILSGIWRLKAGRTAQIITVFVGITVSLSISVLLSRSDPVASFFLLPARAWEMLAGGLVFLASNRFPALSGARPWLEGLGLAMILASVLVFDGSSTWPSGNALLPVIGCMLVLLSRMNTSLWTTNRLAQWLGDRSYSLYLWHWPVFVALAYTERQYDVLSISAGIAFTLLFGELSCRWIEVPARRALGSFNQRKSIAILLSTAIFVLAPAIVIRLIGGVDGRFSPVVEAAAAEADNMNPRRKACHPKDGISSPSCVWGGGTKWDVIALGDSHTSAIVSGISAALENTGVVQWSYSGCSFVLGLKLKPESTAKLGSDYKCIEFIEWARNQLENLPPDIPVVIINRYAAQAFGANEEHPKEEIPSVYFSKIYQHTTPEFLDEFSKHITDTACELAKKRTVYLMRPIPEIGFDVPKQLSRKLAFGLQEDVSIPIEDYRKRNDWVWAAQDAAQQRCNVKILDPLPELCDEQRCYGSKNLRPIYSDDDHLSEFGNKLLFKLFQKIKTSIY